METDMGKNFEQSLMANKQNQMASLYINRQNYSNKSDEEERLSCQENSQEVDSYEEDNMYMD